MMRAVLFFSAFAPAHYLCQDSQIACTDTCPSEDGVSLLQTRSAQVERYADTNNDGGFVFMHMPFNFGNTVEEAAMFDGSVWSRDKALGMILDMGHGDFANPAKPYSWDKTWPMVKPGGFVWGHFNPELQMKSKVTGCPLYLTPPKYWPRDVAQKYVAGNKSIVGVVRDPYEKLVAQFRGGMKDYGGSVGGADDRKFKACDLNGAVKAMLKELKATGDMTQGGCVNIPQSEFFEGEFGINVPVDNWRFPDSMNEKFAEYGYNFHIEIDQILHVDGCNDHWSADFDNETRGLVQELYRADFDLICKHFGHCDQSENTCLQGVHKMCPETYFDWNLENQMYCPRPGMDVQHFHLRMRKECI